MSLILFSAYKGAIIMSKRFTDSMFFAEAKQKYTGLANDAVNFLRKEQLCDTELWAKFVQQFRAPSYRALPKTAFRQLE